MSRVTTDAKICIGVGTIALNVDCTAIGNGSSATGDIFSGGGSAEEATALGAGAHATGRFSTMLGCYGSANKEFATALGDSAGATGIQSTALGANATATATDSLALGYAATASHTSGVAIGAGSATTNVRQVNIGIGNAAQPWTTILSAPSAVVADADLHVNQMTFYFDEAGNNLKVKIKYAGGTVKIGTLAVV